MTYPVGSPPAPDGERDRASAGAILDRIAECVETVSLGFGRWDDPHAQGPGLYFVIEDGSVTEFADPMGSNRWPVEDCASVFDDADALLETARAVAVARDGAVVVHVDGTIEEEMVRLKQLTAADRTLIGDLPYAGWMGARHMSALETSAREEVFAVLTLSEEDGRMTVFTDGTFEDYHRDTLGDRRQLSARRRVANRTVPDH